MSNARDPRSSQSHPNRRAVLRAGISGLLAPGLLVLAEEEAQAQAAPAGAAAAKAPRITVRASGHTLGQVVTAVNRLSPWRLGVSREVAGETVAIDFRGGTVSEFLAAVSTLLGYHWRKETQSDGQPLYRLDTLRATLDLEDRLRKVPYIQGIIALREKVIPRLAKLEQAKRPEYADGGDIWGRYFVSLLSPRQIETLFNERAMAVLPSQLAGAQREALYNCVQLTLKGGSIDERFVAALKTLTPQSFLKMPFILRINSLRSGGVIQLDLPNITTYRTAFTAAELKIPQRVNPYDYFLKKAQPATGNRGKGAEIDPRQEVWFEVVARIREATGKNVLSDDFQAFNFRAPNGVIKEANWETVLDQLCEKWGRIWWQDDRAIYIRDNTWYSAKQEEPPPAARTAWDNDIRAGRIQQSTLDLISPLSYPQIRTLIRRTAWSKWAIEEAPLVEFLSIYEQSPPAHRAALLGGGVALRQMNPNQIDAIRRLLPDAAIRVCAEMHPEEFRLHVQQQVNETENPDLWKGVGLEFRVVYTPMVFTEYQLVATEQERERPWKVARADAES